MPSVTDIPQVEDAPPPAAVEAPPPRAKVNEDEWDEEEDIALLELWLEKQKQRDALLEQVHIPRAPPLYVPIHLL